MQYQMDHVIYKSYNMIHMIPFESYASIPFCGPYFLVGRNLWKLNVQFYFSDKSDNKENSSKGENENQVDFNGENDVIVGSFLDSYQTLPTKTW